LDIQTKMGYLTPTTNEKYETTTDDLFLGCPALTNAATMTGAILREYFNLTYCWVKKQLASRYGWCSNGLPQFYYTIPVAETLSCIKPEMYHSGANFNGAELKIYGVLYNSDTTGPLTAHIQQNLTSYYYADNGKTEMFQ